MHICLFLAAPSKDVSGDVSGLKCPPFPLQRKSHVLESLGILNLLSTLPSKDSQDSIN